MSLVKELKKDKRYDKLLNVLNVARSRIDVKKDSAEAFSLHSSLEVRSLYGKNVFSTKRVLQASAQLQANRSRLVEMRSRTMEHLSYLKQGCLAFKRYCLATYEFDGYRTKDAREALLDKPLRPVLDFISEVETLIDNFDMFIKDIDQAGRTLYNIVEIHKLLDSSRVGRS